MITNKEDSWKKTDSINKGGPKKKAEIEAEVRIAYELEEKKKQDRYGGKQYGGDRRDNRDGGK